MVEYREVLVIEDTVRHQQQISEALAKVGFACHVVDKGDILHLHNYRALHKQTHVIVVDLNLGGGPDDGMTLIKEHLWPADRSAVFVIYSQLIGEADQPQEKKSLVPMAAFVPKIVGADGSIMPENLETFVDVVKHAHACAVADVDPAVFDAGPRLAVIREFVDRFAGNKSHYISAEDTLKRSVRVLNRIAREADSFSRTGSDAYRIAIAAYGSYGRMESRPDSDVEFSIFVDDDDGDSRSDLATRLWNRMMSFVEGIPLKVEGIEVLDTNAIRLLKKSQAGDPTKNGYSPVLGMSQITKGQTSKHANLRNRYYQILIEAQAVFNPQLFASFRKRSFLHLSGIRSFDPISVFAGQFWNEVLSQFQLDAVPTVIVNLTDVKKLCYRAMGVVGLRLLLIQNLDLEERGSLAEEADWVSVLDRLSEPAILKMMRFAMALNEKKEQELAELAKSTIQLVSELCGVMETFEGIYPNWVASGEPTGEERNLILAAQRVGRLSASLLMQILVNDHFRRTKAKPWIATSKLT